ncbi:MAG TPA: hypothetical protein VI756_05285 [Blastocatellia bacterium]
MSGRWPPLCYNRFMERILEGKWEDFLLTGGELAGKRVRITILEAEREMTNENMLAALNRAKDRLRDTPPSGSTEESLRILREGRGGKIFGYEPTE